VLLLGMVLAALEGRTPKDAWREAPGNYRPVPGPAEYLRFLAGNGYALSAIEQVITGKRDAEGLYRELAHDA
jgi:ParB family chromosome partitioning protein